jgi:hypothetical protein
MKNQKVSTALGAIILIIITVTVVGFIFIYFEKYPVKSNIVQFTSPQRQHQNVDVDVSQKTISVVKRGDMNYVIYTDEKGNEVVVEQAQQSSRRYMNAFLSPKENYVLYSYRSWEHENMEIFYIYDINTQNKIGDIADTKINFTPNEQYIYSCGLDYFLGHGRVYGVPGFNRIYNVHGKIVGEEKVEFYNDYRVESCNYDEKKNSVRFFLRNISDNHDTKEVYYDLNALSVIEK